MTGGVPLLIPTMRISTKLVSCLCLLGSIIAQPTVAQVRIRPVPFHAPTRARLDSLNYSQQQETRRQLTDPATGQVPTHRTEAARLALQAANPTNRQGRTTANTPVTWTTRGPLGYSGTVQALLLQRNDSSRLTAWVGSATGGLWTNPNLPDSASRWVPLSDGWSNRDVAALLAQNDSTLYAATGGLLATVPGGGIWKSTDRKSVV